MSAVINVINTGLSAIKSAVQTGAAKSTWVLPYAGYTYKTQVADLVNTWVGRNLNWIACSPATLAMSSIHVLLQANQNPPANAPLNTYNLSCLEVPLLAAWMSGAILATKTSLILGNPDHQLSVGWAKRLANGLPQKGDLVTWKVEGNALMAAAFDRLGENTAPPKLGLAHVTIATGVTHADGSPEVLSFWGDYLNNNPVGPIERTSVTILSAAPSLNGAAVIWGPPNW